MAMKLICWICIFYNYIIGNYENNEHESQTIVDYCSILFLVIFDIVVNLFFSKLLFNILLNINVLGLLMGCYSFFLPKDKFIKYLDLL